MAADSGKPMLELESCEGRIEWRDHRTLVKFDLRCDRVGAVQIELERVELTRETAFLRDIFHTRGPHPEEFRLSGRNDAGTEITTDAAFFSRFNLSMQAGIGTFVESTVSAGCLDVQVAGMKAEANRVVYWLPGFQCFRTPPVDGKYGRVFLRGETKPKDHETLNGQLIVDGAKTDPSALDDVDSHAKRILRVLSAGSGRSLQWSVREVYRAEETGPEIRFLGPTGAAKPRFPLFHYLNWQPALEVAVRDYAEKAEGSTGLGVAIAWMGMSAHFTEGDFITGMTALEHLIDRRRGTSQSLIDKARFKAKLRPRLEVAVREGCAELGLNAGQEETFLQRVRQLNYHSLRRDLETYLLAERVPVDDLREDISGLVKMRNDLVHRGQVEDVDELVRLERVLRELLSRVVLSILGYEGEYCSYLNGFEMKRFKRVDPGPVNEGGG